MNTLNSGIERQIEISALLFLLCLASGCATQKDKSDKSAATDVLVTSPQPTVKDQPKRGPDSPTSRIYLGTDGKLAGRGLPDRPASEVFRLGRGVHPKALSLPGLPKDKFGLIDWASMVKENIITPAGSLQTNVQDPPPLELDVLIKTKGDFVHNVMFRHKPHVYWLDCQNCHDGIFVMAKGKNKMSMQEIVKGKWCGRCHGKVSFPLTDCKRCHSQPK